mgnify:CR=1 FL=1
MPTADELTYEQLQTELNRSSFFHMDDDAEPNVTDTKGKSIKMDAPWALDDDEGFPI